MCRWLALLLAAVSLPATSVAAEAGIELWLRQPGDHVTAQPGRGKVVRFAPTDLTVTEFTRADVQYDGAKRRYRGVPLTRLMEGLSPPAGTDLALLHFANGMLVPVSTDPGKLKALDLWVAVETWSDTGKKWTKAFPQVASSGKPDLDHRPIKFAGNKVVSATRDHPMVAPATAVVFTPWRHVDSLTGIELVKSGPWYRQFYLGADTVTGLQVFKGSCQFCHGVRKIGARLGWDFVEPLPAADVRPSPTSLLFHIRYRSADAPLQGLMMPAIKSVTEAEAKALHAWMQALAKGHGEPYSL